MTEQGLNNLSEVLATNKELRKKFVDLETRLDVIKNGNQGEPFDLSHIEIARLLTVGGETLGEIMRNYLELNF